MADIQFMHFRQRSNGQHVMVGQTVTRIDFKAETGRKGRCFTNARQLCLTSQAFWLFCISAGVNFNVRCAARHVGFDLAMFGDFECPQGL